ncbi:MAG TPA: hypothetical protein VNH20_03160 [Candidatus Dormibacteraeota bacterium]|nr:hypothetical protein [Candidatus Dormibacteraeota bacterium]
MKRGLSPLRQPRGAAGLRLAALALVAMAGAVAYLDDLVWIFVLIYSGVLVLGLDMTWSWWCGRHLRLIREVDDGMRAVGQPLTERFTLENDSGLFIGLVEVLDRSQLSTLRAARVVSLAPRQIVTWEATRRLAVRGRYELGPTEIRVADPLGLFPRRLTLPTRETLVVYPELVSIPGGSLPGAATRTRGAPRAVRGTAPSSPFSRSEPAASRSELLLLLDLSRASHPDRGPEGSLECAVTVAASVAHAAVAQGQSVSLATSDRMRARIPSGRGELHDRNLLDYLATAAADGTTPFAELVADEMLTWRGRGGVVLITADAGQDWVAAAAAASARGERALAIFLDPAGVGGRTVTRVPAQWRLVMDFWVVRHGDDLTRLDALHGRAVV